jgi:8-oxo-dGTP pyrophosphatase MutT (NUDIX family)
MNIINLTEKDGWSCRNYIDKVENNQTLFLVVPQLSQKSGKLEYRPLGGNRKPADKNPEETMLRETKEEGGLTVIRHKLILSWAVDDEKNIGALYGRFHYRTLQWKGELLTFEGYNKSEDNADTAPPQWMDAVRWAKEIPVGHLKPYLKTVEDVMLTENERMAHKDHCMQLFQAAEILKQRIQEGGRLRRQEVERYR